MSASTPAADPGALLCVVNFPANTGYAWEHIEALYATVADRLAGRGVVTWIAYPVLEAPPRTLEGSAARAVELPVALGSPRALRRVLAFVRRHRVRVVYCTDRAARSAAFPLLRLAGVRRIVVHDRTSGSRTRPTGLRYALKWLAARLPGMTADRVIGVSDYVAGRQRNVALIPAHRVVRIWNGVPLPGEPLESREAARRRLGFPTDRPIVVCACRAVPEKGVEHLIRGFERLDARWPGAPRPLLVLVGDGPDRPRLELLGAGLVERAALRFAGYVADATPFLLAADVCTVPSVWQEAFGWSVVEPMALGRAVVASRVGGIPEIVRDGVDGLLVPPADPDAIAAALELLLRDPTLGARMGETGRRRVAERFSRERQIDDVVRELEPAFGR